MRCHSGELFVAGSLSATTHPLYPLNVSVSDGIHTASILLNITITIPENQLPQFTHNFYAFEVVDEAAMNTRVGQVVASLPVIGWTGEAVTYDVISSWESGLFRVDPLYGVIAVAGAINFKSVSVILWN